MKILTKKRRKELCELYEKIQGKEYVRGLENQPLCSSWIYE